jgi:hypothetical protein
VGVHEDFYIKLGRKFPHSWCETGVKQPAISRLEKRSDMYVSHLREVIEAMGGELEITARFNGNEVKITNFDFIQ